MIPPVAFTCMYVWTVPMTVARYFVLLAINVLCYVESAMQGSFWLTSQPPQTLRCDPSGQARSFVKLECAVSGPKGATLRIRWYYWNQDTRGELGSGWKRLLESKQRTIGAEGTVSSAIPLSGVSLSGCYSCQVEVTETPQHQHFRLTAASNRLCFGSEYSGMPPCTQALLVDKDHVVELSRPFSAHRRKGHSQHPPSAPFHFALRRSAEHSNATQTGTEGTSGRDRAMTMYIGIGTGVCGVFAISIFLLAALISGLCWRRRRVQSKNPTVNISDSVAITTTATNGASLESTSLSSASPLRMSAFSRTQSDGDLAARRIPRTRSETETELTQRHRRRSEADGRDEALTRSDRSRSPYRIPMTIIPGRLSCAGAGQMDECPSASLQPNRNDADDLREESGHLYSYVTDACDELSERDENPVREKLHVCHRRSYSEVIILPKAIASAELFDDPKYAAVCIASAANLTASPLPPSQLCN